MCSWISLLCGRGNALWGQIDVVKVCEQPDIRGKLMVFMNNVRWALFLGHVFGVCIMMLFL